MPKDTSNTSLGSGSETSTNAGNGTTTGRRLLQDNSSRGSGDAGSQSEANSNQEFHAATVENDGGLEEEADSSFDLFRDNEVDDQYGYDYDDYIDDNLWGDEEWTESAHETAENFVHIDAHVLCTPVSLIAMQVFLRGVWAYASSKSILLL